MHIVREAGNRDGLGMIWYYKISYSEESRDRAKSVDRKQRQQQQQQEKEMGKKKIGIVIA